jgi:hypothetical protein
MVHAIVPQVPMNYPVQLVFAWAETNDAPVILGRTNFFQEFDVCFFGSEAAFEVTRR